MSNEDYQLLLQIKVGQACRALDEVFNLLRSSNQGLTPDMRNQLWREFIRIDLVKEAA
jgi:hypothetical protein